MSLRSIGGLCSSMVLVAGLVLIPCAGAQVAGSQTAPNATATVAAGTRVHGTITDPDGELIPGATITLTPSKGSAKKTVSGSDGTYTLTVAPGTYTYFVSMPGFASYTALNVKITAVAGMTLDAKLKIGESTEVVNVDANAIQLSVDPDSNASSTILTGKDLEALSDDPDELSSELQALAGPSAGPNGGQIYVDGFTGGQLPPKSSIREIRINQNPFSAQYDRLGFGRIEVFTKPGTDKIHGSLQMNGNPSQFNSPNPLEAGTYIPPYHTVFLFGSVTGPISKIASYSVGGSYRDIEDDSFTNATLYAIAGSQTPCQPAAGGACTYPVTAQISTHAPQNRFDISPRIDLALGEKNVLTTRFQFVHNTQDNQGIGGFALPSAGNNIGSTSFEIQMSDTQTFSSKLINETRFEYERERSTTTPLSFTPGVSVQGNFSQGSGAQTSASDHQDHFEVQNYTSIQLKKNFIRMGGRLRTTREADNTTGADTLGDFIYTSLANYAAGTPSQYVVTQVHTPTYGATLADLGLYAESDWKARQNLTLSYGLRYETQNNLNDHHDFAPRVSVSYGLGNGKTAPKTVLRGGFGMFYDRFGQGQVLTLARQGQGTNVETVYTESGAAIPATCTPSATATCVTSAATTASNTTYSTNHSLRTPYTIQSAIGVDRQLGRIGTVSFNYIHSQGVHQLATQNATYGLGTSALDYEYFSEGVFHQNQLTVNGRVQLGKKVSLFGFYALGSAKGDTSGAGAFLSTPGNIAADYGRTAFDVRQRVFMAGTLTLPAKIQFNPFVIAQSGNPYNVTTGSDNNGDSIFNDRPYLVPSNTAVPIVAAGAVPKVQSIAGCGTFAQPGSQPTGSSIAPINACTGPALFTFNFRLTKTIGFGPSTAKNAGQDGQGGQRGGPPGGGPPGGSRRGGGGPDMFGGGGTSTGKRYNLSIGLQAQNLFNNENLATPVGVLSSFQFGQSTQLAGGPYASNSALRKISLQASFTF